MKARVLYLLVPIVIFTLAISVSFIEPDTFYNRTFQHESAKDIQSYDLPSGVFTTHLPVVSVNTRSQRIPGGRLPGDEERYELSEQGLSEINVEVTFLGEDTFVSDAMFRVRGNSSRLFEKKSYAMTFVEADFTEKNIGVLGMEPDDNWALHGPALDRTLLRNYLAMNLTGELMPYAPDVRFVELFVNDQYEGIYVLMETVSKGEGRVNIPTPDRNSMMTSYIVEIDREAKLEFPLNDFLVDTYRLYPSATELTYPTDRQYTDARFDFVNRDFSKLAKNIYQIPYATEKNAYKDWIDETAFYDYFIVNELFRNIDAGYYSTYFYRHLRGKLTPVVWDFNNSLDNYQETVFDETGFSMTQVIFYEQLLKEERFVKGLIERYQSLRKSKLSDERLMNMIDDSINYLGDAISRNNQRWDRYYDYEKYSPNDFLIPVERNPTSYTQAVNQMTAFLLARGQWLDEHIDVLYQYSHPSRHSFESIK